MLIGRYKNQRIKILGVMFLAGLVLIAACASPDFLPPSEGDSSITGSGRARLCEPDVVVEFYELVDRDLLAWRGAVRHAEAISSQETLQSNELQSAISVLQRTLAELRRREAPPCLEDDMKSFLHGAEETILYFQAIMHNEMPDAERSALRASGYEKEIEFFRVLGNYIQQAESIE